jgi:hypothetical protein
VATVHQVEIKTKRKVALYKKFKNQRTVETLANVVFV